MPIKGLNILYTTAHYPYPPIGGDRSKQYYLLKHLAENNNITVVSLDKGLEVKKEYIKEMNKLNIVSYVFEINFAKAYFNAAFFSPLGKPLEIEFFRNSAFKKKINELIGEIKYDLVISYFLRTVEFVKKINTKKILLAEDCRSNYQARTYPLSQNIRQKMIRFYESKKLRKYESDIMNYFNVTTVVTQADLQEMKNLNSSADIRILTNGVDVEKYEPGNDNDNHKDIVFAGKLDFWLNRLIVERIVKYILPGVKEVHPDVKFHIIGANPTKYFNKIKNEDITLHPDVPDVVPYFQKAALFLNPHIGGSGIQNKNLEAMTCGCPIVTSPSGANGINIESGYNGFIANKDDEFIEITNQLLTNTDLRNTIGRNARELILKEHNWELIFNNLDNIINDIIQK